MAATSMQTRKIVTLGVLSALGAVLMMFEIPYPFVPFLRIDLSDVVVLIIFMMYGWKESFIVGVIKAAVHLLVMGPVGPAGIGQITALIASMSYVLGMYITTNKLNLNQIIGALVTILVVTTIMTVGNYLFITPIWFGGLTFLDVQGWVTPAAFGFEGVSGGYLLAILVTYVPFNLLKAAVITSVFIIVERVVLSNIDQELYN